VAVKGHSDLAPGDHLVFLPAGGSTCTGALFRSTTSGGDLSASSDISLSPTADWGQGGSGAGEYATCVSKVPRPSTDADYTFVAGALLAVTPTAPLVA
jgi:hypothetical protein